MEMDIYMRRRLVALGGLVAFFIIFVLLVKSCGGDDEPETPLTQVGTTDGGGAVALSPEDFILEADAICAQANAAVGALDPTDPNAVRDELQITSDEYDQVRSLNVDDNSGTLRRFMAQFKQVVDALRLKNSATKQNDVARIDDAQLALDTAEAEARTLGERYGFADCGQWLDAGQAPEGAAGTDAGTDAGTATEPTDSGGVAPTEPTTTPPADDTGTDTTEPPSDTGGITP